MVRNQLDGIDMKVAGLFGRFVASCLTGLGEAKIERRLPVRAVVAQRRSITPKNSCIAKRTRRVTRSRVVNLLK